MARRTGPTAARGRCHGHGRRSLLPAASSSCHHPSHADAAASFVAFAASTKGTIIAVAESIAHRYRHHHQSRPSHASSSPPASSSSTGTHHRHRRLRSLALVPPVIVDFADLAVSALSARARPSTRRHSARISGDVSPARRRRGRLLPQLPPSTRTPMLAASRSMLAVGSIAVAGALVGAILLAAACPTLAAAPVRAPSAPCTCNGSVAVLGDGRTPPSMLLVQPAGTSTRRRSDGTGQWVFAAGSTAGADAAIAFASASGANRTVLSLSAAGSVAVGADLRAGSLMLRGDASVAGGLTTGGKITANADLQAFTGAPGLRCSIRCPAYARAGAVLTPPMPSAPTATAVEAQTLQAADVVISQDLQVAGSTTLSAVSLSTVTARRICLGDQGSDCIDKFAVQPLVLNTPFSAFTYVPPSTCPHYISIEVALSNDGSCADGLVAAASRPGVRAAGGVSRAVRLTESWARANGR